MATRDSIDWLISIDVVKLQSGSMEQEPGMAKSASFGVMHVGIAFGVSYALTGSVAVAGAITVVEPACNTVAHYFFDRWWEARHPRRPAAVAGLAAAPAG
jgi:uncharacterized membrane protein